MSNTPGVERATLHAELQAELQSTQQQLAAARAAIGDFAYTVSHDLRAHVRHIQAYAGIVREDWPQAVDLLKQLIDMQGDGATVFSYSMLIRSLRCNLDLADAFEVCGTALAIFPSHPELLKEYDALADALGLGAVQR